MTRFLLLTILVNINTFGLTQNMIPNGSFELYSNCPQTDAFSDYVDSWFSTCACWMSPPFSFLNDVASPDHYHPCAINANLGVPSNWLGTQNAHNGEAYAGIGFSHNGYYEHITVELNSQMIIGQQYMVSLYASKAQGGALLVDGEGTLSVGFHVDSIISCDSRSLPPSFTTSVIDHTDWREYSFIHTATDTSKFIIIGNFDGQIIGGNPSNEHYGPYHFVDQVSVFPYSENNALDVQVLISNECDCNNSVEVVINGGTPPYQIEWIKSSVIGNDDTISELCPGS